MDRRKTIKTIVLGSFLPFISESAFAHTFLTSKKKHTKLDFQSNWGNWPDMKWVGPEYWGNRLQDWILEDGRAVCNISDTNRTLHLLNVQKSNDRNAFKAAVTISILNKELNNADEALFGMRLGAKGPFEDYRSAAVFGKGLDVGIDPLGNLIIGEKVIETSIKELPKSVRLEIDARPIQSNYQLVVTIKNTLNGKLLYPLIEISIPAEELSGNFALLSHVNNKYKSTNKSSVAFSDWHIGSNNIEQIENNLFGPICFAQYTLHQHKLKITAQLSPIEKIKGHKVAFQIQDNGSWKTLGTTSVVHPGRAVNFSIDQWNNTQETPYRIFLEIPLKNEIHQYFYNGTIAKEPTDLDEIKTAVFSCNAQHGFPDNDIHENVSKLNPDIILFLGDQFYESTGGFGADYGGEFDKTCLDYLRKWMMFGWSYRELFRHKPCAIIPDDHDVYHGNVWGEGGKAADVSNNFGADAQDSGGYKMAADWINMVQFTQTSHLPDPYDPTPVKQGIGVYYTQWKYAGLSFAILEDRKFKSAPKRVLPKEAKVWNGFITNPDFDIKKYKTLEADLLGERQHKFLDDWAQDWNNGAEMKVVLSQTNFATVATLPKGTRTDEVVPSLKIPKKGEYVIGDWPTVDMDSNGWPSNQRDRAVKQIRKCFAFHIAGDQHLGSFIRYGIDDHGDSGYAFAGPALNNIWPRRFWPSKVETTNHSYENPAYVGDHIDGFGNKMTVLAVANPYQTGLKPKIIHDRATGYGLVTFNKKERTIKTECWSRFVDPTHGEKVQNIGWPITIKQEDNYGRKAVAWLPEIKIEGHHKPVIKIFEEKGDLVYAMRMANNSFRPKVFYKGNYKVIIEVPEIGFEKSLINVKAKTDNNKSIQINLNER
ncbi:alkaline phosphatase D family protein [Arenibacter certesii]|uniref:PhoD-like phosphatase metallophosphatase domain-containing protein n=1 Tax=Arenibacter certesii TaxID=228955 RepID=A0A918MSB7_9FLAO|nr:alkaline phosphatase D family protein [Arenibacter certesii]GGW51070.1 hypothetical protein GCM10007383_38300 [Arenibacter certesii]